MRRKRFIQLCVRSTTQRRALNPASPLDGLGFLAPRLDVGGIPELFHQIAHVVVIVTFVQAYALRILPVGLGRWTGMLSKVASTILES